MRTDFQGNSDGLCCVLIRPCPRPKPPTQTISRDVWEVSRDSLQFIKKLGHGMFGSLNFHLII